MSKAGQREASADLIMRAQRERAAFAAIYDLYIQRIYGFCLVHSGSKEEAEDLTSQTFERALVALPRYHDQGTPLSAWLLRIAANAAIDRQRRAALVSVASGDSSYSRPISELIDLDCSPDHLLERWERVQHLHQLIAALPAEQRRAVRLRYLHDQGVQEIAAHLGRSDGAIKQLLHRALTTLRRRMQDEEGSHVSRR